MHKPGDNNVCRDANIKSWSHCLVFPRLATTVRSCLFDTAQENCGRPAASYLQQYMDATIEPFSKFLSCPPPKSGRPIKAFEPRS